MTRQKHREPNQVGDDGTQATYEPDEVTPIATASALPELRAPATPGAPTPRLTNGTPVNVVAKDGRKGTGVVIGCAWDGPDSHGLCYSVLHGDGVRALYEPDEVTPIVDGKGAK
jgi:hypothetical protein